jgi:uncharacterized protein involved in response to NO
MSPVSLAQARQRPVRRSIFFAIGFRPFFLLATLFGACGVPLWLHLRAGDISYEGHLGAFAWHGHEMIFGFTVAIFAGFLLTAAQNWTGRVTARGPLLAGLALLWVLGRGLLLAGAAVPAWLAIAVDLAFLPALALVLFRPIWQARNRRNFLFPVGLLLLGLLNAGVHAGALGLVDWTPERFLWLSLDLLAAMIVVMGGRVIPFFTRNALPQAGVKMWNLADWAAIGTAIAIIPASLLLGDGPLFGAVALLAGLASLVRMLPWRSWATRRSPILWILHVGYLWLAVAFTLRGLAAFTPLVLPTAALHAMGAGVVGTLTLGMMSRVSLGHTGRAIRASRVTVAAYLLVILAGVVRVAAALAPAEGEILLEVSGALWAGGFLLFLGAFAPLLARPRPDGRPG